MSERIESIKAGSVAAFGGMLGLLPSALTSNVAPKDQFGDIGVATVTCVLFGLVYRYAVAADRNNTQLKGGVVAAFGLTRGLALAQNLVSSAPGSRVDAQTAASAALVAGQSMLVIAFAAAAIELAFSQGYIQHFGEATKD